VTAFVAVGALYAVVGVVLFVSWLRMRLNVRRLPSGHCDAGLHDHCGWPRCGCPCHGRRRA